MFSLHFDKPSCQNVREATRKEWLETNGRGDYASSTLVCCNTRKYHGLLVANLKAPPGRHVLLSTIEESLVYNNKAYIFSCRKHPGVYHPRGWEYQQGMQTGPWPVFTFRFGNMVLTREILMPHGVQATLLRYSLKGDSGLEAPFTLCLKPLLAFRHFHALTAANFDLRVKTTPLAHGFTVHPYEALPVFYMQTNGVHEFFPAPDWYRNIEYTIEAERGFADKEDLFMPGCLEIELAAGHNIICSASTAELTSPLPDLWEEEAKRRATRPHALAQSMQCDSPLLGHLAEAGEAFLIHTPYEAPAVLAGYHWFDAWGRDSLIALPGLTFLAGRPEAGRELLASIGQSEQNGLIPNCFAPDNSNHAYNSVDASLWFVWAAQQFALWDPQQDHFVREHCWPVIKNIINGYKNAQTDTLRMDEKGLLHVGNAHTQLTWMDAMVADRPVTPRHGCPVEINALWYNALCFADELAARYNETSLVPATLTRNLAQAFHSRFWVHAEHGYLADVWREDFVDISIRPNQIFAVSMPYSILPEVNRQAVVERVRSTLLTPFGLRTLSPEDPQFIRTYCGKALSRDSAYHQGTVWPWLLGAYGEALLRTAWDTESAVQNLLETVEPLVGTHFTRAGLGFVSEVFDAVPPYYAGGCIAQAWSVAEILRLCVLLRATSKATYDTWENSRTR